VDARTHAAPEGWTKACRCGETWSTAEWAELPAVGRYLAGADGWFELRSCVCGATLAVSAADHGDLPGGRTPRPASSNTP